MGIGMMMTPLPELATWMEVMVSEQTYTRPYILRDFHSLTDEITTLPTPGLHSSLANYDGSDGEKIIKN